LRNPSDWVNYAHQQPLTTTPTETKTMTTTYTPKPQTIADIISTEKVVSSNGEIRSLFQTSHSDGLDYCETGTVQKLRNILKTPGGGSRGILYFQHPRSVVFGTKSISYSFIS
jgi:hypothetical protein